MAYVAGEKTLPPHETLQIRLPRGHSAGQHAHLVLQAQKIRRHGRDRGGLPRIAAFHRAGQAAERTGEPAGKQHGQQNGHGQPGSGAEQQQPAQTGLQGLKRAGPAAQGVGHAVASDQEDKFLHLFEEMQAVGQFLPGRGNLLAHQKTPVHGRCQILAVIEVAAAPVFRFPGAPFGFDKRLHDGPGVPAHQIFAQAVIGKQAHQAQRQAHAQRQQHKGRQHAPTDAGPLSHASVSLARLRR